MSLTIDRRAESNHRGHSETVADFWRCGFVVLRGVLPRDLVRSVSQSVQECMTRNPKGFVSRADPYADAFTASMNVWTRSSGVRNLIFSAKLAQTAAYHLKVSSLRLSHDYLFWKSPGQRATPIHADQYSWPVSTEKVVTVWIPLQETGEASGPIRYYKGSFRLDNRDRMKLSESDEDQARDSLISQGFSPTLHSYDLGDLSLHLGWTFHDSLENRTTKDRLALSITFMEEKTYIIPPPNGQYFPAIAQIWCPGCDIGDLLDSELNPVIWREEG